MINIDEINKEYYDFPTIDFKFQNTGNATALLWQFTIDILQAKVNTTPDLSFITHVSGNNLEFKVDNFGWGTARNCVIELLEPNIGILFLPSLRQFNINITSGESASFTLKAQDFDQTKFQELLNNPVKRNSSQVSIFSLFGSEKEENQESSSMIELDTIKARWNCIGDDGQNHSGISNIRISGHYSIGMTRDGFVITNEYSINYGMMLSDTTYISMIDPSKGTQTRQYPISRQIPPGGVERFHIMVGATMSCDLMLKFRFAIDKSKVLESEEFAIQIYNPRNSRFRDYSDGDQLERQIEELERKIKGYAQPSENIHSGYREKVEIERLRRRAKTYPFTHLENDTDKYE